MKIDSVQTWLIDVPQIAPIAPYENRYRAGTSSAALIVRVETDGGIVGWGETPQRLYVDAGPFSGAEGDELNSRLQGWDPFEIERLYVDAGLQDDHLQSGIEMALWDIAGKVCGQPLYQLLGGAVRAKEIELAACMGIQPYDRAGEIARHYTDMGFSTLKTKAGRSAAEDLEMVRGVRDAVGDRLKLRIDPNQGYSPDVAKSLARDLEPFALEYLEQPMDRELIAEAAQLRRATSTPIALNESVTTPEVALDIVRADAAAVLLPDTYQCGGILGVRKVATIAAAARRPCVMHCAHDFGLKTAAMLHIVVSTPAFTLANDCTYYGLESDITVVPFEICRGRMRVPEAPGLGVEIDLKKLEHYARGSSCPRPR